MAAGHASTADRRGAAAVGRAGCATERADGATARRHGRLGEEGTTVGQLLLNREDAALFKKNFCLGLSTSSPLCTIGVAGSHEG